LHHDIVEVVIIPEVSNLSSVSSSLEHPWKLALEAGEEESERPGHQGDVVDQGSEADANLKNFDSP